MGKFLVASGLASILFSGPEPEAAGALTLFLDLPEAAAEQAHEAELLCGDGEPRTVNIDARGKTRISGVPEGQCGLRFEFEGRRYGVAVVVGAHDLEHLTVRDHGSVVPAANPGDGMSISTDEMRKIPVGSSTSRDFTAVVDMAPTASRDSAGISLAGTTGAEPDYQAGTLTAGAVDDLADAKSFAHFMAENGEVVGADKIGDSWAAVRVTDSAGRPVRGMPVTAGGRTLMTRADGRVVFVEGYDLRSGVTGTTASVQDLIPVKLQAGKTSSVKLGFEVPQRASADVLLVLDTTGSMGDELRYLQVELRAILQRIERQHTNVDLRWGLVVYRDQGDQYVVRGASFTQDFATFENALAQQVAGGGGDMPEAVHSAFATAAQLNWRPAGDAARIVLHVADAPPHADKTLDALEHVDALRAAGTAIYPVAASGLDAQGEFFMRSAALMSGGQYVFLTDDSGIGGSHREATAACFKVNTLATVLHKILDAELRGHRPKLPRGDRGGGCQPVGVARQPVGPHPRSMSRSLFDDDAAAEFLHQPYVRRKIH